MRGSCDMNISLLLPSSVVLRDIKAGFLSFAREPNGQPWFGTLAQTEVEFVEIQFLLILILLLCYRDSRVSGRTMDEVDNRM